jgi:hypothetical protein
MEGEARPSRPQMTGRRTQRPPEAAVHLAIASSSKEKIVKEPEMRTNQNLRCLAFGLLFDRTLRMMELHEGMRGRGVRS